MFSVSHYRLVSLSLFICLNVEQTSVITTAWTPRPAHCPAVDSWSVCVLPGLRDTNAKWTSVFDAMEHPASLMRAQEMWFASKYLFTMSSLVAFPVVGLCIQISNLLYLQTEWANMIKHEKHSSRSNLISGIVHKLEARWTDLYIMHMFHKAKSDFSPC